MSPTPTQPTSTAAPEPDEAAFESLPVLSWTNDEKVLQHVTTLTGPFAPKSVVASGAGLYFAQNMMYRHTISVFDLDKQLVATIPDSVDLNAFGFEAAPGTYRGAPVEAAFTSNGWQAFVSNYRMYGPGYSPTAGGDTCAKDDGQRSFVYRIDTRTLEIDRLYRVGAVPKFLAVTPDDRLLLVSNWCSFDVTVIDLQTHKTLAEVEVGRYPRGIAVTSDSATAYIALMGAGSIAMIDLTAIAADAAAADDSAADGSARHGSAANDSAADGGATDAGAANGSPADDRAADGSEAVVSYLRNVGSAPRHLVLSPDDETLYVSLNLEGAVVALDPMSGEELRRALPGDKPRSMDISTDGTALYVVNYDSATMTKLRTSDFVELQRLSTAERPIGLTYDPLTDEVWVSAYSGVIEVYVETEPAAPDNCDAVTCDPPEG